MKHLTLVEILKALNDPSSAGEHLNECDVCLKRFTALKEFQSSAKHAGFLKIKKTDECPESHSTEDLAAVIEGIVTGAEAQKIKKHIAECDRCFDYASYYASEKTAMEKAMTLEFKDAVTPEKFKEAALAVGQSEPHKTEAAPEIATVPQKAQWRIPQSIARFIFPPLPAYVAAAVFLVSFYISAPVMRVIIQGGQANYAVYRSSAEDMPFLYFGQSAERLGELQAGMSVTPSSRGLRFRWDEVEGAGNYYFILQETRNGVPRTIRQFATAKREVFLPRGIFTENASYKWISAGLLPGNRRFMASLEFRLTDRKAQ